LTGIDKMPLSGRFHLTLTQKLIISFAINGICLAAALVYSIHGLNTMHRMADDIARNDLAAATDTITLRDTLLAQERVVGRFLILETPEFKELYNRQVDTFRQTLAALRHHSIGLNLAGLTESYSGYTSMCARIFAGETVYESAIKRSTARVEKALDAVRSDQHRLLELKLKEAEEREAQVATLALGLALAGVTLAFFVAALLIYSFSTSINKLQKATHRIAAGEFDHDPHIPPGDEIGTLAQDFIRMAIRLKELEQISLDASPLTRLPGNIAIERVINRRIKDQVPFAMCYMDLDNFKSYNDRYGYIRASELLKETGLVIHDAVKRLNDPDAFVGHIGGDDFVAIINSRFAKAACQSIIHDFDAIVPSYYSEEDRAAGAIDGIDRYGVPRRFPLISISIAVMNSQPGQYATAAEIATAAAAVKDRVKESSGSNYIIVREAGTSEV
jgi:diguanylate cyclase (GGDEF)-like protein